MKIYSLLIVIVYALSNFYASAQDIRPDLSKAVWEEYSDGVAITYTIDKESRSQTYKLILYIKNISNTNKELDDDSFLAGIEVLNSSDTQDWKSLRPMNPDALARAWIIELGPGEIATCPVELTAEELKMIKSHSIRLHLTLFDDSKKQVTDFKSLPKNLVIKQ
jgi:hypothetical protein